MAQRSVGGQFIRGIAGSRAQQEQQQLLVF
jgi:hypothetical protein